MSGTRQVHFTPEMDKALLQLRGTMTMDQVARKVGVGRTQAYRRLHALGQPIRRYIKHNRRPA